MRRPGTRPATRGRSDRPGAIVHVAPFLWSGAGSVITRLCEDQARGQHVLLITTGKSGELRDWPSYRRRISAASVGHLALDVFHRDGATTWAAVSRLADVLRDLRPRVVHAHAGVPTGLVAMAREVAGTSTRLVGQMYSWGLGRPAWMDQQDLWGFSRADAVVCSARHYMATLESGGIARRRLVYLPWGLPLNDIAAEAGPPCTERPVPRGDPRIGFVGRIEERKDQLALVHAFALLRRRWPRARLDLVGPVADEAYAARILSAIDRHGLTEAVRLTGQVRSPLRLVRGWDAFVSLSSDEGQGLAVLEAMALGVPVVAKPVAGIADYLVDRKTGLAVGGDSTRAAANRVDELLDNPTLARRLAARARRMVERRYDWQFTLRAFEKIYVA